MGDGGLILRSTNGTSWTTLSSGTSSQLRAVHGTASTNVWFAGDNTTRSAKLDNAVEGDERERLWNELREFIIVEGKEEGDEDDDENNDQDE